MTSAVAQWPSRVLRFDRDALHLRSALLRCIAVLICLVWGLLTGHLLLAFTAALGALLVGMLDHPEAYIQRLETMAVGLAVMTPVVLMAGVVSRFPALHLAVAAVAAFACGLAAAWGPRLGMAASIALAIFAAYAGTPTQIADAVWVAVGFAAGGVLQVAVCLAPWVFGRPGAVHVPVADAWRVIGHSALPDGQPLMSPALQEATGAALARAGQLPPGVPGTSELQELAHDAEVVRLRLVVAGPHRAGDPAGQGRTLLPGAYVTAVADACLAISKATSRRRQVKNAIEAVAAVQAVPGVEPAARADRELIERALTDATGAAAALHRPGGLAPMARAAGAPIFTRPLELGWASPVVRQAVRLTVTFTLATLLGLAAFGQRSYWIAFTVALVTQPGYAGTVARALSRIAGTLLGLLLVVVIVAAAPTQAWWFVLVPGLATVGIYLFAPANYGLAVVFITVFALLPIEILGGISDRPLLARAIDTLIGGTLVIVAAMVAPRRSAPKLASELADLVDAFRQALTLLADGSPPEAVEQQRRSMLELRSRVAATLDQAWMEPRGHGLDPGAAQRVLGKLNVVAVYRGDLIDGVADPNDPELQRAIAALAALAKRLRGVGDNGSVPPRTPPDPEAARGLATEAIEAAQVALDAASPDGASLAGSSGRQE